MRSQEQKLLDLLSNHNVTFFIPPYQRNYEWDEAQVTAFWNDVLAVYRNYRFFQGKLKAHQMAESDLTKLIDWGIAQFSVVTVELETENAPRSGALHFRLEILNLPSAITLGGATFRGRGR